MSVTVARAFELIDQIAAPFYGADDVATHAKTEFSASLGTNNTDSEIDLGELITALRDALHSTATGIWLDINEAHTINQQARAITQTHIGVPSPTFDDYYTYTGNDATEALTGYHQWLQTFHDTYADTDEPVWGLIEIITGADYHLAILTPTNTTNSLIATLTNLDITARQQTNDPWPHANQQPEHYNFGEHIEQHLINHHHFTWDQEQLRLVRQVNDDVAILAFISPFERGPKKGIRAGLDLKLSLADYNAVIRELAPEGAKAKGHRPTISERLYPGYRRFSGLNWEHTKDEVNAAIDKMIASVLPNANRDFILQRIADRVSDPATHNPRGEAWIEEVHLYDYAVLCAMRGWIPEQHDYLFDAILATHDENHAKRINESLEPLKAWITDHPTGTQ